MVNFHYDWEFKEDGKTIQPISMGMVDDIGRELYMIYRPAVTAFRDRQYFGEMDETDLWLRDNVFNHISEESIDIFGLDSKVQMGRAVYDFICDGLHKGDQAELWGYFAAYDHVCLSQLFGRMIDLPPPMPMYTNELMTIRNRRSKPDRPKDFPEHHALWDAKYQKLMYHSWSRNVPS
jgi:hypothetical protein